MSWPEAELDSIQRLRVLGASVPGAIVAEATLYAPFEQVWAVAADLEHELPTYLPDVRSFTITTHQGQHLEADARGYLALRARFDVVLRPGWCVMRSRFLLGGLAAVPNGEQTRFAFLAGLHIPAQHVVAPALDAFGRWATPRVVSRFAGRVRYHGAGGPR
jgi:hypothetical protein